MMLGIGYRHHDDIDTNRNSYAANKYVSFHGFWVLKRCENFARELTRRSRCDRVSKLFEDLFDLVNLQPNVFQVR